MFCFGLFLLHDFFWLNKEYNNWTLFFKEKRNISRICKLHSVEQQNKNEISDKTAHRHEICFDSLGLNITNIIESQRKTKKILRSPSSIQIDT